MKPILRSLSGVAYREAAFVGRTVELDVLRAILEQVRRGLPRVALVTGPPGIGKTTLLRRLLREAAEAHRLWASGDELESRLIYGVVEQLRRGHAETPPADERDPLAVGADLVCLFQRLQADGPVVVVVDDAHWADTSSLHALTFALRRLHAERVLCVIAARDDAPDLPEGLTRIVASERGVMLSLDGLGAAELIELAAGLDIALPHHAAERLRRHTGGNPLHVRAVLEQLEPDVLCHGEGPLPVPRSFTLLVLGRLAACSAEAERLVAAAAVFGQPCPLILAGRLAELPDPLPAWEEAIAAGLLAAPDLRAARLIAFPHPLVRAAVYHDLGPARRARLHTRVAELIDPPASLEHRAAAVIEHDAELSDKLASYGTDEMAGGAFAAAAAHLETAARLSPHRATRERLLLESVESLLRGGEIAQAEARVGQVLALPDSARQRAVLGHLALLTGHHTEAEALLIHAWERCDRMHEADVGARAAAQLARLFLDKGRSEETILWARRACELNPDDPFMSAAALGSLVLGLAMSGHAPEGLALVADLAIGQPDLSPGQLEVLVARGLVRLWTDDLTGAREDLLTATDMTGPWKSVGAQVAGLGALAVTEYRLGAWDDSLAHAAAVFALAEATDNHWLPHTAHAMSACILAARGEWEAAHRLAQAALSPTNALGAWSVADAATAAAWVASTRGDHMSVLEATQQIVAFCQQGAACIDEPGVFPWRELRAEALVSLGRLDEAEAVLAPLEALASVRGRRFWIANAARVRGTLEAARDDHDRARAAFESGLRELDGLPVPFHRALLTDAYGRFLRRAGKRHAANRQLHAARDTYLALAARPFLERCERELAACGLSPARRTGDARTTLTPQELVIARLVATGLTNRQTATELVISVKTVEYHLSSIYAKLGLHSRSQLPALFGPSQTS
jgi:DNA-binding CsgD family transcriptional regulator